MPERPSALPTTEELLQTLEICRRILPDDANPAHDERLAFLSAIIPWWREQIHRPRSPTTRSMERRPVEPS